MKLVKGKMYKVRGISPNLPPEALAAFSRGSLTVVIVEDLGITVYLEIKAGNEELLNIYEDVDGEFLKRAFSFTPVEVELNNK